MIVNDLASREMAIMPDAPSEVMLVKLKKAGRTDQARNGH